MNVIVLYHATQTFTNTVFEHLNAFARFSRNRYFFCHHDQHEAFGVDLSRFDALVVHYCLRLPYDQFSEEAAERISGYGGLKVLFIQDEYDHTRRAWHWIKRLGFDLVFTVVPQAHIDEVYPPAEFPGVRFVSNLTGYVPEELAEWRNVPPPSERKLLVGFRGRPLPVRYGMLGIEKVRIGKLVKTYCDERQLPSDVAWTEQARIYGPAWYEFLASCRGMLGSESGSNVFDWEGDLARRVEAYRQVHPAADEDEVYQAVISPLERPGLMNQISPRVFEAISLKTVLVLFEGTYSGVIRADEHFIPLRKDGSNLNEVFSKLQDDRYVDDMAERAWTDIIAPEQYTYPSFVAWVDREMAQSAAAKAEGALRSRRLSFFGNSEELARVTTTPVRWPPPLIPDPPEVVVTVQSIAGSEPVAVAGQVTELAPNLVLVTPYRAAALRAWAHVPRQLKPVLLPIVKRLLIPSWRVARRTVAWRR